MVDGVDEEIVNDQLLLEGWRHLDDHVISLLMMEFWSLTLKRESAFMEILLQKRRLWKGQVFSRLTFMLIVIPCIHIRGVRMKICRNFAFFCSQSHAGRLLSHRWWPASEGWQSSRSCSKTKVGIIFKCWYRDKYATKNISLPIQGVPSHHHKRGVGAFDPDPCFGLINPH